MKQVEADIDQEKQRLAYVEEEALKYEKALMQSEIKQLMQLEKRCHDSFSWPYFETDVETPIGIEIQDRADKGKIKCEACAYDNKSCQDLLIFKQKRILFLQQKIREVSGYHNQLVDLSNRVCYQLGFLEHPEENRLIIFNKQPFLSVVCFNTTVFKPSIEGAYTYDLIYYDEKKLQVQQKQYGYYYEINSRALEGTCLEKSNQVIKLIKVDFSLDKEEALEEVLLNAMCVWIKQLNHQYKRRYGSIHGIYIELPKVFRVRERIVKKSLEKLGYRTLGKMNEQGIFEENTLLVYLSNPLY